MAVQAEQVARSITNPDSQARTLVAVAGALASNGQHAQATAVAMGIARSITDLSSQAWVLVAVAGALAELQLHDQACVLLAQATVVGEWTLPIRLMVMMDPVLVPTVMQLLAQ